MQNVVGSIIKLNILVFFLWVFMDPQFMIDHFLVSSSALLEGRPWTLLTSAFSHNMPFHIFINMYVLYGFGLVLNNLMGAKRFLIFYLIAGAVGSLGHCLASTFVLQSPGLPALGASGAISGVLVLFSLLFPTQLIYFFGLIPMPAYIATTFFVGVDLWGLIAQSRGSGMPIGFGAHLGGAFAGALYYFSYWRPRYRPRGKMQVHHGH